MSDDEKTKGDWDAQLTPEQVRIMRQHGTERAFTGAYWDLKAKGTYRCAACGTPLFASETKYDSGTGWPSFWAPLAPDVVGTQTDFKLLVPRVEVHCKRCEGHLGHVFDDGPRPTGKRFCLNSASLRFEPAEGAGEPEESAS